MPVSCKRPLGEGQQGRGMLKTAAYGQAGPNIALLRGQREHFRRRIYGKNVHAPTSSNVILRPPIVVQRNADAQIREGEIGRESRFQLLAPFDDDQRIAPHDIVKPEILHLVGAFDAVQIDVVQGHAARGVFRDDRVGWADNWLTNPQRTRYSFCQHRLSRAQGADQEHESPVRVIRDKTSGEVFSGIEGLLHACTVDDRGRLETHRLSVVESALVVNAAVIEKAGGGRDASRWARFPSRGLLDWAVPVRSVPAPVRR